MEYNETKTLRPLVDVFGFVKASLGRLPHSVFAQSGYAAQPSGLARSARMSR